MATAFATWISETRDTYIGNATAVRDYRVQLRGNRSVLLFGIYLATLIGVAVYIYSSSTSMTGSSIVDAQMHLRNFYHTTMMLLGLTVTVVAPALTATSIVAERQRQSIDLIFSAPVTPKYYLVGKMISSFRYTWMLLVLALPVTAASVVLGGASWGDVLAAYVILSLQGLILTSFALLMSTISPKPVGAIIWSYSAAILYNVAAYSVGTISMSALRTGHGAGSEAPFTLVLSPFMAVDAAKTYTTIATHQIPNWFFLLLISLLVCKICLLGAGSLLSASGGKEIVGLRIHGLLYTAAIATIAGWIMWPSMAHLPVNASGNPDLTSSGICGIAIAWCTTPFVAFIPFISCFGFDREIRNRPNGVFSIRRMLDGTPIGGLPFLLAVILSLYFGFAVGGYLNVQILTGAQFWLYGAYTTSFWVFFWSLGRLFSALAGSLKAGRTLVFAAFVLLVVMPFPFLIALTGVDTTAGSSPLWDLYVISPLTGFRAGNMRETILYIVVFVCLSLISTAISESRIREKLSNQRNYDERPFQTA